MSAEAALAPEHAELIAASAISAEVATARGYRTVKTKAELKRLGFTDRQASVPALLLPVYAVTGELAFFQIRPDIPRISKGKPLKYETPLGARMAVDVPPASRSALPDPSVPLFITEGIRKADAGASVGLCTVDLIGVWNWRGTNEHGGKTLLADFEAIALNGRHVYICFDSDVMEKDGVRQACQRLASVLQTRGANVRFVLLSATPDGSKQGLDDFLASGATVDDLINHSRRELPDWGDQPEDEAAYVESGGGLVWRKPTNDGYVETTLTNFTARIVSEVEEDDGVETRTVFDIEATLSGRSAVFQIPAAQFSSLNWAMEYLGASAILFPGFGSRDHARAAVQLLSGTVPRKKVYAHTGWRELDGVPVYLHAGGAIGSEGMRSDVTVALPDSLAGYELPEPPNGNDLRAAIRASLRTLTVAPPVVTYPLLAGTYRAACGPFDASLHAAGPTGAGKTELAALFQQHFGPTMHSRRLPGSWDSTANANEALAFAAKDALFVVDDFMPNARAGVDAQRLHRDADRLMRARGNSAGRARMRPDTTLRTAHPPRAVILSTGEDIPRGQSLRARMLVLELSHDELDWSALTQCQFEGAAGLYASAMAGFVRWLAINHRQSVGQPAFGSEVVQRLREDRLAETAHPRVLEIEGGLLAGLQLFLQYATEAGAITAAEAATHEKNGRAALRQAAQAQAIHQATGEPAGRFLQLVASVIGSGRGHLAANDGEEPDPPQAWGWRRVTLGSGAYEREEWRPQAERIGWIDGDDVYLIPDASVAAVRDLATAANDAFTITTYSLSKRLHERGLLVATEARRGELTVRRMLEGRRRRVWQLRTASLCAPSQSAQSAQDTSLEDQRADSSSEIDTPPGHSSEQIHRPEPAEDRAGRIGRIPGTSEVSDKELTRHGSAVGQHLPRSQSKQNSATRSQDPGVAPSGMDHFEV